MKLNLLPTYVSKEKSAKAAWVFAVLIAVIGCGAAFMLITQSKQEYKDAKDRAEQYQNDAAMAVAVSKQADETIAKAREIIVNIDLANAMRDHNKVYAELYDDVKKYIPGFFRISSISATPSDANSCVVTMQGVIQSYQQYADLMLALLRIPDSTSVSRNGYQVVDAFVPPLTVEDQKGKVVKLGEPNIPDDPVGQIDYFTARSAPTGYVGTGGFGSGTTEPRGAMPGWQAITVSVVLSNRHIQTPDPRATLTASASAGPSTPAPGGMPGPTAPPSGPPSVGPGGPGGGR